MGPLQGNLAIRIKNLVGNICPQCRAKLDTNWRGRFKLYGWTLKVLLVYLCFLLPVVAIFGAFTYILATRVL